MVGDSNSLRALGPSLEILSKSWNTFPSSSDIDRLCTRPSDTETVELLNSSTSLVVDFSLFEELRDQNMILNIPSMMDSEAASA